MFLRNLLLAIGIIALLAGVGLATVWYLQPSAVSGAKVASTQIHHSILVAAQPISAGNFLRSEDLRWQEVAATEMSRAFIYNDRASDQDYVGALARRAFAAGEPLTVSALVKSSDRGFLAAALIPGMRAVSIAVDAPQSTSGMILPGDRVDAILTQRFADSTPIAHRSVGETILENLRVVAVDQWMRPTAKPGLDQGVGTADSRIPKTITLEVSPNDAEKLLVAIELGKVGFVLRPVGGSEYNNAESNNAPVWASDVSRAFGGSIPTSPRAPGVPRALISVEIVRGTQAQTH